MDLDRGAFLSSALFWEMEVPIGIGSKNGYAMTEGFGFLMKSQLTSIL